MPKKAKEPAPDRSKKFYDDDADYFPEKVEHYVPPAKVDKD